MDDSLVVINKPSGIPVHRDKFSSQGETACLQTLRDQLGKNVHPVHRLDRPTSGVLLFAFEKSVHSELSKQFMARTVFKTYQAILRGWLTETVYCDEALEDGGNSREAISIFNPLSRFEFQWPNQKFSTSRYTLVDIELKTGRFHQIRRHANHMGHPVVGDTTHGDGRHNKLWRENKNSNRLLLHATSLSFIHPVTNVSLRVQSSSTFESLIY